MARPKAITSGEEKAPEKAGEETAPEEAGGELVDMVTVMVPKTFKFRPDNFREVVIPAGVQEMERTHAENWWVKANGVTIYEPNKGK